MSTFTVYGHLGGTQHRRAVARVFKLLLSQAEFTMVAMEYRLGFGRGSYDYVADVYGISIHGKVVVEVDGKTGHNGKRAVQLDKERDAECRKRGIAVVRFQTQDLVSRKPLTDAQILQEIEYRLGT